MNTTPTDAVLASVASAGTTLSLAATTPLQPEQTWTWLPYLVAVLGPALSLIANRVLGARGAAKQARAVSLRREAAAKNAQAELLLQDALPANDIEGYRLRQQAHELQLEADALDAEADVLMSIRPKG